MNSPENHHTPRAKSSRKRWVNYALFAFLLVAAVTAFWLIRGYFPTLRGDPSLAFKPIGLVHPDVSTSEAGVQTHLRDMRASLDRANSTKASPSQRAAAWNELGRVYFAYEFYAAAAGCFTNALSLQPANGQFWYALAESRFENAEISAAVSAMQEAVKRTIDQEELNHCHRFLGDAYERLGQTGEARREFKLVVGRQPQDSYSWFKIGRLAAETGDSASAVTALETALKLAPGRREIAALLAQESRKLGRTEIADGLLRTLRTTDQTRKVQEPVRPDRWRTATRALNRSAVALHARGISAMKVADFRPAAEAFETALRTEPGNIPTRVNLALCRLELGEVVPAGDLFLQVLSEEPTNESARKGLALSLARSGRASDAVRFCSMWQTEKPNEALPVRTEAEVRMIGRDYKGAAVAYQRLTNMQPSEVVGPMGLAMAQAGQGLHTDARTTLELAAQKLQGRSEIIHTLARLLVTSPQDTVRNPARALKLTEGLVRTDAPVTVWETHALTLAENGRWEEASTVLKAAIQRSGETGGIALAGRLRKVEQALSTRHPFREAWPFAEDEQRPQQ